MNACSFAAGLPSQESGVGAAFGAFHGQMGCIYLFEDVLNPGMPSFFVLALPCIFSLVLQLVSVSTACAVFNLVSNRNGYQ